MTWATRERRRRLAPLAIALATLVAGATAGNALMRRPGPDPSSPSSSARVQASTDVDAVRDLLGGIDYVPTREALDAAFADEAEAALIALARDRPGDVDAGVRIRALRALALYADKPVETTLADAVEEHRLARDGVDIAYLRAAMHSLAVVTGRQAVRTLEPVLDHVMRDARAAAADALAVTRARPALRPLYRRLEIEPEPMVRQAIEAAIRALSEQSL